MNDVTSELRLRLAEIEDLHGAAELLGWDQQTKMPPRGAARRAETLATVHKVAHERFVEDEIGSLADAAAAQLDGADPNSDDVRLVAEVRRRWEKSRRVPADLAFERARAASVGQEAWVAARAANDFASFAPHLQANLDLARRYIDCFDGNERYQCAYDVLLDDYDPGQSTVEVRRLFDELKAELVPLIARVSEYSFEEQIRYAPFPVPAQRQLAQEVLERMTFEPSRFRLDDTVHPFAMSLSNDDVRITTRFTEDYFPAGLYGVMHEFGHGLFSAGVADALQRTPLGSIRSLSIHESQSRLWENMVGRGRQFCDLIAPRLAELGGGSLVDVDGEQLFRAVNQVTPSLIRIEADETTYGLHIIIRFELEQDLIEGRVQVADLPEAWNAKMKEYLGVDVPSDAEGVMQDVHWSAGLLGYFPTYSLGNLIAGQLWQQVHIDLPSLDDELAAGDFTTLLGWLREKIHRHGSKFSTGELLEMAVGRPIEVQPFVGYLKSKLSDVYGLDLA